MIVAKALPDSLPLLQGVAAIAAYFGYFFFSEWLLSRTLGKLATGLVVVQMNGGRITLWQALVRTLLRVVEVNPILLGAMPAAILIILSRRHQRLGDMLAGTLVVPVSRVEKSR